VAAGWRKGTGIAEVETEQGRKPRIILASASPRRRELLAQVGFEFEVMVSKVEEQILSVDPGLAVEELSRQKAETVLEGLSGREDVLVIGADTVVAVDGRILGKPSGEENAAEMLRLLSGRSHEVYTGVTLLYQRDTLQCKTFHEKTRVKFYPMTEQEISFYVSTGDCLDKAGAYGIQGLCARYVRGIEGDYNNVIGLPVGRLYQELFEEVKEWIER